MWFKAKSGTMFFLTILSVLFYFRNRHIQARACPIEWRLDESLFSAFRSAPNFGL
jgi:hypothetical protein